MKVVTFCISSSKRRSKACQRFTPACSIVFTEADRSEGSEPKAFFNFFLSASVLGQSYQLSWNLTTSALLGWIFSVKVTAVSPCVLCRQLVCRLPWCGLPKNCVQWRNCDLTVVRCLFPLYWSTVSALCPSLTCTLIPPWLFLCLRAFHSLVSTLTSQERAFFLSLQWVSD